MPRNGSGSYSLPAGNPVSSGTLIEASWANTTLSDIASAVTDSLARSGEGGMTGPLRAADGTVSAPSVSFVSETATGFYRAGATDVRFAMAGVDVATLTTAGVTVGSTKVLALPDGTAAAPALTNTGDTNTGVFFPADNTVAVTTDGTERLRVDASGNVGVGTSSPYSKLTVSSGASNDTRLLLQSNASGGSVNAGMMLSLIGSNGYVYNYANGPIIFGTNGADRATLDASGNLGLGVTPSAWGNTYKVAQIGSGGGLWGRTTTPTQVGITTNVYNDNSVERYIGSNFAAEYLQADGVHYWFTAPSGTAGNAISFTQAMTLENDTSNTTLIVNGQVRGNLDLKGDFSGSTDVGNINFKNSAGTRIANIYGLSSSNTASSDGDLVFRTAASGSLAERARITSYGDFLVGATSQVVAGANHKSVIRYPGGGSRYGLAFIPDSDNTTAITFANAASSLIGSITVTGSATAYNTSSDYRLKENIQPMTGGLAKVAQLKPCTYTWKANGTAGQGFIAHELAEVVPDAVTGEKDAVNEDGSIKAQGIDTSFLVATLTAALQEAHALIKSLEQRVAALEAQS